MQQSGLHLWDLQLIAWKTACLCWQPDYASCAQSRLVKLTFCQAQAIAADAYTNMHML
jgi:hypothetical protein